MAGFNISSVKSVKNINSVGNKIVKENIKRMELSCSHSPRVNGPTENSSLDGNKV